MQIVCSQCNGDIFTTLSFILLVSARSVILFYGECTVICFGLLLNALLSVLCHYGECTDVFCTVIENTLLYVLHCNVNSFALLWGMQACSTISSALLWGN